MEFLNYRKIFLAAGLFLFLFFGLNAKAADNGSIVNFNVDKGFDAASRTQLPATLVKAAGSLYFYIEEPWWSSQTQAKQTEILANLDILSQEFNSKIYPNLTSVFGPAGNGSGSISVLFELMNSAEGGYFREADEYAKLQMPTSNERQMLYLSLDKIGDPQLKVLLAHEFTHLITFNQKNKNFGVEEDTWLNEARADCSSTILGYDNVYNGSNLQQRVKDFVDDPSDPLIEWLGTKYDYASVSLFTHYLVDHYGINILADSLQSKYIGVQSVNYALQKNGYKDDFPKIFTNWTIASFLNNCSINQNYCYLNSNLKSLRLSPPINFLPVTGNVSLSVTDVTKSWAGNWLKLIGGNGDLKLGFSGFKGFNFQIPYILEDNSGSYAVKYMNVDANEKGEINIKNFGTDYIALIIIPSLQSNISGFDGIEPSYPFTYSVFITGNQQDGDQVLMQKLLDQIASLKAQIAMLQNQNSNLPVQSLCSQLNSNLHLGMSNSDDVKCLQTFLKNQGTDIYPEGFITGNFGNLTAAAVMRFQEKYASSILAPAGLLKGTGYVGVSTRTKINQLLNNG